MVEVPAKSTSEDDKTHLLYRISAIATGRVLEISSSKGSALRGQDWIGQLSEVPIDVVRSGRFRFPACHFDLAVLHGVLDEVLAERGAAMLGEILRALRDGGVLAGCVENKYSLERIKRLTVRALRLSPGKERQESPAPYSASSCRSLLLEAGFRDIRVFGLSPQIASPYRLLSVRPGFSRKASRRHAEATRPLLGGAGYATWRVLAEFGVAQYLNPATFFWARRPC